MRKGVTTLLLVFAFAAYGAAQQPAQGPADSSQSPSVQQPADHGQSSSQQSSSEQHSMAAGQEQGNSISGCLQASAGETYTLQTKQGNIQVKAEDDLKDEISKHVGKEIRVVGEWGDREEMASNRDQGADLPQGDQPNAGSATAGRTFDAEKVDVIEETCSTSGLQQGAPEGMNPGAPPESRGPEGQPQGQSPNY
jgi:hypothetical protein